MNYKIIDVEGIGEVYSEKLIAAGIKDIETLLEKCAKPAGRKALEFRHRLPENLQPKLEEINAQKNLVGRVPSVKEVEKMVEQAKALPPVMEY